MNQLSTGAPSTLGSYLALTKAVFGDQSPAVTFLRTKIAASPYGDTEPVLTDEGQMIQVLHALHERGVA